MMRSNKKGFTLIELLAVILILGVIALIAIPIVSNVINESKTGAFKDTVSNLMKTVEDKCQLENIKGDTITSTYLFTSNGINPKLSIKGKIPTSGTIIIDNECDITYADISDGINVAYKPTKTEEVSYEIYNNKIKYDNGQTIFFNPETGLKCTKEESELNINENSTSTNIKTGCMKWHTFNDEIDSPMINMILDHNTTSLYAWISTEDYNAINNSNVGVGDVRNTYGPITTLKRLKSDTETWRAQARLLSVLEVIKITGNRDVNTFDITKFGNDNWFYLDGTGTKNQTEVSNATDKSKFAWLYNNTNSCGEHGCTVEDSNMYSYKCGIYTCKNYCVGYWLADKGVTYAGHAWSITNGGRLNISAISMGDKIGIRPVISIPKTRIAN